MIARAVETISIVGVSAAVIGLIIIAIVARLL